MSWKDAFWLLLAVASTGIGIAVGHGSDAFYGLAAALGSFGGAGMLALPLLSNWTRY